MKPEEAYNLIEMCLDYDKDMSDYPERYEMALQIAREVFHKQTPVKPTYGYSWAEMCCSVCGSPMGGWAESNGYCPNCGQAIDWSEE